MAVVRQIGNYFQLVGTCFVVGMRRSKQIQLLVDLYSLKAKKVNLR